MGAECSMQAATGSVEWDDGSWYLEFLTYEWTNAAGGILGNVGAAKRAGNHAASTNWTDSRFSRVGQ